MKPCFVNLVSAVLIVYLSLNYEVILASASNGVRTLFDWVGSMRTSGDRTQQKVGIAR